MNSHSGNAPWIRWLAANGLWEIVSLGLTFAVGAAVISSIGDQQSVVAILATFFVAVASGAIEANLVGQAQWRGVQLWSPMISRRAWWQATLVGALVAYVLGYLPPTLMSLSEQASQAQSPAAEPDQWVVIPFKTGSIISPS